MEGASLYAFSEDQAWTGLKGGGSAPTGRALPCWSFHAASRVMGPGHPLDEDRHGWAGRSPMIYGWAAPVRPLRMRPSKPRLSASQTRISASAGQDCLPTDTAFVQFAFNDGLRREAPASGASQLSEVWLFTAQLLAEIVDAEQAAGVFLGWNTVPPCEDPSSASQESLRRVLRQSISSALDSYESIFLAAIPVALKLSASKAEIFAMAP